MQFEGAYTVTEFLNDVQKTVWVDFSGNEKLDFYRRGLQRSYIEKLRRLLLPKDVQEGKALTTSQRSDVALYGKQHLVKLRIAITKLIEGTIGINKEHFENSLLEIDRITYKLNKNNFKD